MPDQDNATRKTPEDSRRIFESAEVEAHMERRHPNCPEKIRKHVVRHVSRRSWKAATLGAAVGISLQAVVRHELTDYDQLLKADGIDRAEARAQVKKQVLDIIASWAPRRHPRKKRSVALVDPVDDTM